MRGLRLHLLVGASIVVASCSPTATQAPPGATPGSTATSARPGSTTPSPSPSASSLTLWLPASLDPTSATPAASLLGERLADFERANPGVTLTVRIKDESGPAGLMETLSAAADAAPASLPDLIALDAVSVRSAALKGLIAPLSGVVPELTSPEWYDAARASALVDGSFYAIPFAADADVIGFRVEAYDGPPLTWEGIVSSPSIFIFPAADPDASVTLSQYLSLGGSLVDSSGRPTLDPNILAEVLGFYQSARQAGVLPISARQLSTADDTWQALLEGSAQAGLARLSAILAANDSSLDAAPLLPDTESEPICFVDFWSWAIVTRDPARQARAAQLLSWLSAPEFLGPWTFALGALPPAAGALELWPPGSGASLASRLVMASTPRPSEEIIATVGAPLRNAAESVLTGTMSPEAAALAASQDLLSP
jgi:ABC-type glycerol-3-phosphate transport system substrate-binding protein